MSSNLAQQIRLMDSPQISPFAKERVHLSPIMSRKVVRSFNVYVNVPSTAVKDDVDVSSDDIMDDMRCGNASGAPSGGICNVLSYPLQSKDTPSPLTISNVQFKPSNKIVNMSLSFNDHVPLDPDMQHKFRSQNEHENEHENEQEQEEQDDDGNSDGNNPPLSTIMDSITFKSSYVPPVCNVAVGKIRPSKSTKERDEIHLTPIHSHYMMRPGFKHIDDLDVKDGKDNDVKEMEEEVRERERRRRRRNGLRVA